MKLLPLLFVLLASLVTRASAQSFTGVDSDGYIGVYEVGGQNYWWLCIEPNGSPAAATGESFFAAETQFPMAWDRQNAERLQYYLDHPAAAAAMNKQVRVMSYVLDTYLDFATLTTPGAVLDQTLNSAHWGNNESLYNSLYVVQQFIAQVYSDPFLTSFSAATSFDDRWKIDDPTLTDQSRSALYQSILADVSTRDDGTFFENYNAVYDYYSASTEFSVNNTTPGMPFYNWQDVLIIMAPVPEPGGALLIGCCGLALLIRRRRLRA